MRNKYDDVEKDIPVYKSNEVTVEHGKYVNVYMIPSKVSYFLSMARFSLCEYIMLFYVSTGLSLADSGLINGLQLVGGMVAAPLWSFLADKMGNHKSLSIFICIMAVLTMSIQPVLNEHLGDEQRSVCPYNANVTQNKLYEENTFKQGNTLFIGLLITAIFAWSFDSTVMSFMDAGVIQRIQTSPRPSQYGHQRLFGGIGYSLGSMIFSASISYFPTGKLSCYTGIFVVYASFTIALAFSFLWLFNGIKFTREEQNSDNVTRLLLDTLKNWHTIFILISVLVLGVLQGLWYSYVFVYMKEINSPILLLGLSTQSETVSALIIYVIAEKLISSLGGPTEALALSSISWAIRFMCLTHMKSPYVLLGINLLHGLCFPLCYLATTEYIKTNCDSRILTTVCGIRSTLNTTGLIIANLIGGHLYRMFGGRVLFLLSTAIGGFWGITIICVVLYRNKRIH